MIGMNRTAACANMGYTLTVAPAAFAARIAAVANSGRYRQYPSQCSQEQLASSQSSGSDASEVSSVDAPSAVRIVRCPSGVTWHDDGRAWRMLRCAFGRCGEGAHHQLLYGHPASAASTA